MDHNTSSIDSSTKQMNKAGKEKRIKGISIRNLVRKSSIICLALLFIGLFLSTPLLTSANSVTDQIRVALFVDIGSRYQNTVPMVSLSSEQPLKYQGESGAFHNLEQANYSRFTLDQFYLIAFETNAASDARQASQRLAQNGFENSIVPIHKNKGTSYRVVVGTEAEYQAISQLKQEVQQQTSYQPIVAGPYRVLAGSYSDLQDAQNRLAGIRGYGFPAYLVQVSEANHLAYEVWVGDEANKQSQAELQQRLEQALPHVSFEPAQAKEYLIHQETVLFGNGTEILPFLFVSPHSKLSVIPQSGSFTPLIKVEERENRSYRGTIELSRYQNHFTVVNVLPLEEYLYSVVGTEMSTGWPIEALKTQAVMSRNYAYHHIQGNTYGIAHLSDTVYEQAYYGYGREGNDVRQAVDATKGEFLTYRGNIFSTFYHSNAGGHTADGREVWGSELEHHSSVQSQDVYPETVQVLWYRVQDQNGKMGYISSEYVSQTSQQSNLHFTYGTITTNHLNFRSGPSTSHEIIGSLQRGDRVLIMDQVRENNAYSWMVGPYTGNQLQEWINASRQQTTPITSSVTSLSVTEKGPSGRVMKMEANGQPIQTSSPDAYRSVFKDGDSNIRSTRFEVEEMADVSILGAGGKRVNLKSNQGNQRLYAVQGSSSAVKEVTPGQDQFALLNPSHELRIASKFPLFRLHGKGFGHGLGASQWGVYSMASGGYDYEQILKHYFHKDAKIEKLY